MSRRRAPDAVCAPVNLGSDRRQMAIAMFSVVGIWSQIGTSRLRWRWSKASSTSRVRTSFNCFRSRTKPDCVNLAFNCYFKGVIVPVAVRVIALAEKALVLFRRKVRVVVIMRGGNSEQYVVQALEETWPRFAENGDAWPKMMYVKYCLTAVELCEKSLLTQDADPAVRNLAVARGDPIR